MDKKELRLQKKNEKDAKKLNETTAEYNAQLVKVALNNAMHGQEIRGNDNSTLRKGEVNGQTFYFQNGQQISQEQYEKLSAKI